MAAESSLDARGFIKGLLTGSRSLVAGGISNANSPGHVESIILTTGDNTIDVPNTSVGCIIRFANNSSSVKKLKGAGADTGITLRKNSWNFISFDTTPMSAIIINSSTIDTGNRTLIEFL